MQKEQITNKLCINNRKSDYEPIDAVVEQAEAATVDPAKAASGMKRQGTLPDKQPGINANANGKERSMTPPKSPARPAREAGHGR